MSPDFEHLVAVAGRSRAVDLCRRMSITLNSAWRSSRLADSLRVARADFTTAPAPDRLQWLARVAAIAAGGHAVLRLAMPVTVVPATPAILPIGILVMAGLVAWQPAAFHRAWRTSRLSRALSRRVRVDDAD